MVKPKFKVGDIVELKRRHPESFIELFRVTEIVPLEYPSQTQRYIIISIPKVSGKKDEEEKNPGYKFFTLLLRECVQEDEIILANRKQTFDGGDD